MHLDLKRYQKETIAKLGEYCDAVRAARSAGSARPEAVAFANVAGDRTYHPPPGFDGVPYLCLRLPTGGGKTLLAAHAVGVVAKRLLGTDAPACLWICPSTTIRDQTLRVLRDKPHDHHYLALRDALGPDVAVATIEEALQQANLVAGRAPLVIVTTIQSYPVKDEKSGDEVEANRRIYRDDGYLQRAFDDLPPAFRAILSRDENGLFNLSLANALVLRAPIVIMDEAHNARTPTSFESLARFGPSCVVELTATPQQTHAPSEQLYASNVLHPVSALQLKSEGMIKLPIDLESRGGWLEVLAATKQRLDELDRKADEFEAEGGRPIRPIALIQAQPERKDRETHHAQAVKKALLEKLDVPPEEVRICTGKLDELGDEDLMSRDSRVRFVITVDKLREGWDCPFAYVLGSIGNAATPTAVEQLLGRVIRQPYAHPTRKPALDRAYAFVLSDNVTRTAIDLRDGLIKSCGFDKHAAADALRTHEAEWQPRMPFGHFPIAALPRLEQLPGSLRSRVTFDADRGTLAVAGEVSHADAVALRDAVTTEQDRAAVEEFWNTNRPVGITTRPLGAIAPSLFVPRLALKVGDRLTLLEPEELDQFAWDLDNCAAQIGVSEFADDVNVGTAATLDLEGEALRSATVGEVRLRQLEIVGEGENWPEIELARWLDRDLHADERFMGLAKSESQPFMLRVIDGLVRGRGLSLPVVVRRRHQLARVVATMVSDHGRQQVWRATEQLIREAPESVEASPAMMFEMREEQYAPYDLFEGHRFPKHAFDKIAKMNGEETDCAAKIDAHPRVARWVRNADRETQGGFSLPKSPGRFFPDFIVELIDGVIVAVEYKSRLLDQGSSEEQHKRKVGELWASRSNGRCRFAWVVEKAWTALARELDG